MSVQTLVIEGNSQYAIRVDEDGTFTYIGQAEPGSLPSASVWRVKRLDESSDPDITITWADGDDLFDNIWDDRISLSYS